MQLRNPQSAKFVILFLIPVVIAVYRWWQYRPLLQSHFGVTKIAVLVLWFAAAAYFLWYALRGQSEIDSKRTNLLAVGMGSFLMAVTLTLNGLGYQFHVLKVIVVTLLYVTAAFLLWNVLKRRSTNLPSHHI